MGVTVVKNFDKYGNLVSKNETEFPDGQTIKSFSDRLSEGVGKFWDTFTSPFSAADKGLKNAESNSDQVLSDIADANRQKIANMNAPTGQSGDVTKPPTAIQQSDNKNNGKTPTLNDSSGNKKNKQDEQSPGVTVGNTGSNKKVTDVRHNNAAPITNHNTNEGYNSSNVINAKPHPKGINEPHTYNGGDNTMTNAPSYLGKDFHNEEKIAFAKIDELAKTNGVDAGALKDIVNARLVKKYEDQARADNEKFRGATTEPAYNIPQQAAVDIKPENTDYSAIVQKNLGSNAPTQYYTQGELLDNHPDYYYNPLTKNVEVKVVSDTSAGYASEKLLNNFKNYKKANSGVGMSENFGITKTDLSNTISQLTSEFVNIVPDGVNMINSIQKNLLDASNAGNYQQAYEYMAQLKMATGAVAGAVLDYYSKYYGNVSLAPNYDMLKKSVDGGNRVSKYYQMSYSDIAKEISASAPQVNVSYKSLNSASDEKKSLIRSNPLYKQLIQNMGEQLGPLKKQLIADLYGSNSLTSSERKFLSYLSNHTLKAMETSYNEYKSRTSKADADAAFPMYQSLKDLTQIQYRTGVDDYLDRMGKAMSSSFIKPQQQSVFNQYQGSYGMQSFDSTSQSGGVKQIDVSGTVGLPTMGYNGVA